MNEKKIDLDFDFIKSTVLTDAPEGVLQIPIDEFVKESWINDDIDSLWVKNYQINKDLATLYPAQTLRKPCIFVGASPAIKKNMNALKKADKRYVIIACNSIYKTLLQEGIQPDFVFALEARDHIVKDLEGVSPNGTILIVSPFVAPQLLKDWPGEKYFHIMGGGKKFNELIREDYPEREISIGGGNVVSTSMVWALDKLHCRQFIITGMSLCYYDDYYHDGRSTEYLGTNVEEWKDFYQAVDIYGKVVNTTPALTMYKTWLETFMRHTKYSTFINATEDGILGVYPVPINHKDGYVEYEITYLPWINIMPLSTAIEALNKSSILRTLM